jgi:hypothetical protein
MLMIGLASPLWGQVEPSTAPVAHLQYREVDYSPLVWEIKVELGTQFVREPAFDSKSVFRGRFCLGTDTNHFLPFAWDSVAHRIYLDLNRNGDLTDDPAGMQTSSGSSVQLFRNIRVTFPSATGTYPILMDAHVFEQIPGQGQVRVFLYVRSQWDGRVELNGKPWYVAVIGKPDGKLSPAKSLKEIGSRMVLRPWDERNQSNLWWHATLAEVHGFSHIKLVTFPYRYAGNAEVFDAFNLPNRLFFQGQASQLEYQFVPNSTNTSLDLVFHPLPITLGKVRWEGENIRRVILDGSIRPDGMTAIFDRPTEETAVPVGIYQRPMVLLQRPEGTNIAAGISTNLVTVSETNVPHLYVGGPLSNLVSVRNSSYSGGLPLEYSLVNHDGAPFHLVYQVERKTSPLLSIQQGAQQVGQGSFEFG